MENNFCRTPSVTGLATTAVAFLAFNLMPDIVHQIPEQEAAYGQYANLENQKYVELSATKVENKQSEILLSFVSKLSANTKDLDTEIAQIISNDFWEMYDRF